ncbi:alpha/beta fold hydrolase [Legionella sp. CNM-4043-24]|uniref:alpha/beta fold hydrolase n=1 Tax=Legionella sp. CNM-4043-24 TaxID=3421646 RepID=UPI00403AF1D2
MKDKIHFAHGNGFPSACYRQLFLILEDRYECDYISKVGHDPRFPVSDNWENLVDEVITSVRQNFNAPVIGLGHSLGGVLTFLAAIKEPSLFKAVVMIDSPLLNRFRSRMVRFAKSLGFIDQLTPAARTRGRRHRWETKEELMAYLKSRPLFKTFNDACLQDYIDYGVEVVDGAYQLVFDREIEYRIFRTIPHHLPSLENRLMVPTSLIYGDKSSVVDHKTVRYMEDKYQVRCYKMPGGHMLPMQNPQLLAEKIYQALDACSMVR